MEIRRIAVLGAGLYRDGSSAIHSGNLSKRVWRSEVQTLSASEADGESGFIREKDGKKLL